MLNLKINSYSESFLFPFLCFLALLQPTFAWATDYEVGKQAYLDEDYALALKILRPLAEEGDSQAQVTLGIMYDFGRGVAKDPVKATELYIQAAEQGIPVAQHDVGVKYFQGQGVKQDYLKAAYWWEKSADAGLVDSQFNLGLLYYRGIGLEINYQKASTLFILAAEQDHPHAQYGLAVMYAFGQGLDQSHEQALVWFRKSAAQNVAQAQFNLGVFYEKGYGLDTDIVAAKKWYALAADAGLAEARSKLLELEQSEEAETIQHPDTSVLADSLPVQEMPQETAQEISQPSNNNSIKREDWVQQQSRNSYTLQLSSILEEKNVVDFIQKHQLVENVAYIEVFVQETVRYSVLYGSYTTYSEAKDAINLLPESLSKNKPWVRNFGILQNLIDQR